MARSAKTVSVRQLQAAVTTALEAAKKKHPHIKLEAASISEPPDQLPIMYRYPWFCGLPPFPWPESELQDLGVLTNTLVSHLAATPAISAAAADGKFQPAIQYSGGTASIGFAPADISLIP
jgi:hypothetical protein